MLRPWLGRCTALGIAIAALAGGAWQRSRAAQLLPPDYDELVYLPAAIRQEQQLEARGLRALPSFVDELGHPPLVKIVYGVAIAAAHAPAPDLPTIRAREPLPAAARPAFAAARGVSAAAGVLQLGVLAAASPFAALLLAFDPYHAKYTSLAMLEGIPGLFALLAALLLERAFRPTGGIGVLLLLLSAVALGAAAAGKYAYGLVLGLTLAPFVLLGLRRRLPLVVAWVGAVVATFFALTPNLWLDPLGGIRGALGFHWGFSHGANVTETAFPWWAPLYFLTHANPVSADPGVFVGGAVELVLLPLAALGFARAWRTRRVFAAWAIVALAFLLAWPTK